MNPCATPPCLLPDVLEARRHDILRRWEARASEVLAKGTLLRVPWVRGPPGLVDALVDLLRGPHVALDLERARAFGGRLGRERREAGVDLGTLVHEYGLLRDAILEVLEEAGWSPELAALRTLNRALDVGLADAVAQYGCAQEEGARATESTLLGILDHAPASIYAKDTRGRYLFINRALEQSLGKRRHEVVGRTNEEVLPPGMAGVCELSDRQVLASSHPIVTDEQVFHADGPHTYQSVKFPLPDALGGVAAICGISTDVTEMRRAGRERDEAREQLSRIITRLPIIIWSTDENGIITLCEGEGLKSMGMEGSQLVGRNAREVYADRPDLLAATSRARGGESFAFEMEMHGSWFVVSVSPVFGPDGRVLGVAGVTLDITERHRAQEVLRQSEMRYRLATLATSDVIYDWQFDTGHIEWSELAAQQFRLPPHHMLDIDEWTRRIHPEDRGRVSRDMQAVLDAGGCHWADEYRFLRGDGTWAVIADRGQVLRDAAGRAVRMVGAMQDITERRAAEQEAKRRAEFEQLLIGIVGHDLRNPISAITMATTTLLRRENLDERQRKIIGRILSSAERATRMLRDVLDFTQARLGGGIPMQPRLFDLHELTRQVVDEVQLANPERLLFIECTGDGRGQWDADRLAQVITNLVNNAIHHSLDEGPVHVRTHGTHRAVALAVHNPGPAIPPELRSRLFEPMKRGERTDARDSRGLGLGLFIVKHIVDAHGGMLRVRSSARHGTTFLVRLPRQLGRREAAASVTEVAAPHASA